MSRFATCAAALLLSCAGGALAQDTGPASRPADATRLIQLLDSDDFATREQATRDLIALGERGRAALVAAKDGGSLERQMRIAQILQGIVSRSSSRPARKDASRVTVEVEKTRLSEVAALIGTQTGYSIRTSPGIDRPVTLSVRDRPFFEAVDLACAQAGARLAWDPRERGLVFEPSAEKAPPASYAGPLRISLVVLNVNRQLRFGGGSTGMANLQIRVEAEERAQPLAVVMPVRIKDAVDDQGRSLKPADGAAQGQAYPVRFDQRRQLFAFVQMSNPEGDAKAIGRMEFTLQVVFPTEFYEAEVPNPAQGSEAGQGDFHVSVSEWKEVGNRRQVSVVVTRPTLGLAGSPANATLLDDTVTFLAADGSTIPAEIMQSTPSMSNLVYVASIPESPGVATLRIACVKQFETVDLPVVFENVALP